MNLDDFYLLQSPEARAALRDGRGMEPSRFALQLQASTLPSAPLATQLKYLARAQDKFPAWHDAECLFEPQAFEQATSEAVAAIKPWGQGEHALDLTCGLGVDSWALSRHYNEVTSIESDRLRFVLARYNLGLLGADNITVWHSDAETWLEDCGDSRFDLIYIDPDRRDASGGRRYGFADCSPNVLAVQAQLLHMAPRVLLKASPMLDIDAALQELSQVHSVTVLAADGECKELLFELRSDASEDRTPLRGLRFLRRGRFHAFETAFEEQEWMPEELPAPRYIYEADISAYKAKVARQWFQAHADGRIGQMNHPEAYYFSDAEWPAFPGRAYEVLAEWPWKPAQIKKQLKAAGIKQINLTRRHFDLPLDQVRQQLGMQEGGADTLLLTQVYRAGAWTRMAYHTRRVDVTS